MANRAYSMYYAWGVRQVVERQEEEAKKISELRSMLSDLLSFMLLLAERHLQRSLMLTSYALRDHHSHWEPEPCIHLGWAASSYDYGSFYAPPSYYYHPIVPEPLEFAQEADNT